MFDSTTSTVNRLTDNSNLSLIRLFSSVITKKNANKVYSEAELLLRNGVNVNAVTVTMKLRCIKFRIPSHMLKKTNLLFELSNFY